MTQPQPQQERERARPAKADEREPEIRRHVRDHKGEPSTTPHEGQRDAEELSPDDFE